MLVILTPFLSVMKSLTEKERDEDLYNPQGLTEEERATCPWVQMTSKAGVLDANCVNCPLPYAICWVDMKDDPNRKDKVLDCIEGKIREHVGFYTLVYHEY